MEVITISNSDTGIVLSIVPDTQVAMEAQSDKVDLSKAVLAMIWVALDGVTIERRYGNLVFQQFTI